MVVRHGVMGVTVRVDEPFVVRFPRSVEEVRRWSAETLPGD
jgi:hypothetical protein